MKKLAFFLAAVAALGQTPAAPDASGETPIALIRFRVESRDGKPVANLRPDDIYIREDGALRNAVAVESGAGERHDIPIEISILFDCDRLALSSGTLDPRLFHQVLLDEFPNAWIAIYGFSPGLTRLAAPTRNQADLVNAMEAPQRVHPLSTFLMDHISRVMMEAASSPGAAVRMLAIVSTGQTDQGSSSAAEQQRRYERAVAIAQRTNISVFPVVLIAPLSTQDSSLSGGGANPTNRRVPGPEFTLSTGMSADTALRGAGNFVNLASATGGYRAELVARGNMLPTLVKWLADQIRSEHVAAYHVSASRSRQPRKVEVVMRDKDRGRITSGALRLVY